MRQSLAVYIIVLLPTLGPSVGGCEKEHPRQPTTSPSATARTANDPPISRDSGARASGGVFDRATSGEPATSPSTQPQR
jgi:hypothetical protein